jgi:hypothetical protein
MPNAIHVVWSVTPRFAPQPWRPCSRCGEARPFRCSGKFRLNANGKRLDVWLIHKCASCDQTWNRTVIERRAARDFEPTVLAALEANDPELVRRFAFDVVALRRAAHRVEEFPEVEVRKEMLGEVPTNAGLLQITLVVPIAVPLRLDRLLAAELGLPRSHIAALLKTGRLRTTVAPNRPVRHGAQIEIDLVDAPDVEIILRAAPSGDDASGCMDSED